ncbi:MAG: nuclear transport factor 2 family protein [Gammaproteobacteria bacterium]|jgi:hypothetical protein|nr:nuclear transport factor 2 family protein [Gammaproteobacteria bacterium]
MNIANQLITGQEAITDTTSPYASLVNFYSAFNQKNFDSMQANWLQSGQASMSNPLGGLKRGWNEIQEVYQKIFNGPAKVYVEFYDFSIHATKAMFIAVGRERGFLEIGAEKIDLAIRTTRIYLLDQQQWKQLHHHGSMDNPELLSRYQTAVLNK